MNAAATWEREGLRRIGAFAQMSTTYFRYPAGFTYPGPPGLVLWVYVYVPYTASAVDQEYELPRMGFYIWYVLYVLWV